MEKQSNSKKAEGFWYKARNTVNNYELYIKSKPDKFALSFTDLLYASNFKAGNGNVQEPSNTVNDKLKFYSDLLREIDISFGSKSLASLAAIDLDKLLAIIDRLIINCTKHKIDGFGVPYCSALFHFYFPNLIPILDRRMLMGIGLVNEVQQMNSYGQVRNIEKYYPTLIEKLYNQLKAKQFNNLEDADKYYFKMVTPENLKTKNLRSLSN